MDQEISSDLIDKLELIRVRLNDPIIVTSGFRCFAHQYDLTTHGCETAKGVSQHELGNAADLVASDMGKLLKLCEKEFMAVGVSHRFIHVDLRSDKPRRWQYQH